MSLMLHPDQADHISHHPQTAKAANNPILHFCLEQMPRDHCKHDIELCITYCTMSELLVRHFFKNIKVWRAHSWT